MSCPLTFTLVSVTDSESLGSTVPWDIRPHGAVEIEGKVVWVGRCNTSSADYGSQGICSYDGKTTILQGVWATDVNQMGVIASTDPWGDARRQHFESFRVLNSFEPENPYRFAIPRAINQSNDVCGQVSVAWQDSLSEGRAFIWPADDSVPKYLEPLRLYEHSVAHSISDSGVVCGASYNLFEDTRVMMPTIWFPNEKPKSLSKETFGFFHHISPSGEYLCVSVFVGAGIIVPHYALVNIGPNMDQERLVGQVLATRVRGFPFKEVHICAVNDSGWCAGYGISQGGERMLVALPRGEAYDINMYNVGGNSGYVFERAVSITPNGYIVGYASHPDRPRERVGVVLKVTM